MDSTLLTLLSAFVPAENPKAAAVIFASGEVGKVDDPALHGDAHDAMQDSARSAAIPCPRPTGWSARLD